MRFKSLKPLLVVALLQSCISVYKPNMINSPVLKEKGQANISGGASLSGSGLFNLQTAYALTNNIGLMANGMYHQKSISSSGNSNGGSATTLQEIQIASAEIGAGYTILFTEKKNWLFQNFGGIGLGKGTDIINNISGAPPKISANYLNAFMQPGIVYTSTTGNVDVSLDVRANYVNAYRFNIFRGGQFIWIDSSAAFYASNIGLDFLILEPTLTIKLGNKNVKGIMQLGATIPTYNQIAYFSLNSESLLALPLVKISFGFKYTFGIKPKEKTQSTMP